MNTNELKDVDSESQKFIRWSFEAIADDKELSALIDEVTTKANTWLHHDLGKLRKKLLAKMIKGAKEHGAPRHTLAAVAKELEGEYLDLLGWTQIKKYNEKKRPQLPDK